MLPLVAAESTSRELFRFEPAPLTRQGSRKSALGRTSPCARLVVPERPLVPLGIEHAGTLSAPFRRLGFKDAGPAGVDRGRVHGPDIVRLHVGPMSDGPSAELRLLEVLEGSTDHHDRVPEPELGVADAPIRVGPGEEELEPECFEPRNRPLRVAVPELRKELRQGTDQATARECNGYAPPRMHTFTCQPPT